MNWLRAAAETTRAKTTEELMRHRLLRRYAVDNTVAPRISEIMNLAPGDIDQAITEVDARSIPSNPAFVASGWSEHMLLRYLLALDRCAGARVLDSCCGLGWGSYLVASAAEQVVGLDLDPASVAFCRRRWGRANIRFEVGSVLELPFENDSFDVVLCMDAIEHFSRADAERYLGELQRVCRGGGQLFGSSAFPATRYGADRLCARNPHHLHIYTRDEVQRLLHVSFGQPRFVTRHYFQAAKR